MLISSRLGLLVLLLAAKAAPAQAGDKPTALRAGFGAADITPALDDKKPVFLAGFGKNRKATGVHDPLFARAVVLDDGKTKIAIVSVDLVGFFLPDVERVRAKLPGFAHVLVSSTHGHEGPDTLGLWGASAFVSGVDPGYIDNVIENIVKAVRQGEKNLQEVSARIGTASAPELLHDGRLPKVLHDDLVALHFLDAKGKNAGVVVQWNCHPETLGAKNTLISADYVGATVEHLRDRFGCPVVYLTGTVGGLMTSLHVDIKDDKGAPLADGTFEKTREYGVRVGKLAEKALGKSKPVALAPIEVRSRQFFVPMDNVVYQLGWKLGVFKRQAYLWEGKTDKAEPAPAKLPEKPALAIKTELSWLKLGELEIAAIPGEIYPELVLGKVQDPVDPGADFRDAPVEPAIYHQLKSPYKMLIGLASDEIGYIIPKRQWDERSPFCYGLKKSQYGEVNSLGTETAPILCEEFRRLVERK